MSVIRKLLLAVQVVLLVLPIVSGIRPFFNGRRRGGSLGTPKETPNIVANRQKIKDMYCTQKVDNFNRSSGTWKNRYYQNAAFYQKGGAIFLMFSGESAASKSFMLAGSWINYANTFNAMLFELEHRYYGLSHPTPDISTDNLKHLFSAQALADAANFIQTMNKKHGFTDQQKWIVFGGSYSGSLAIWMRQKYPNLVAGAVGSSGPVYLQVNFKGYLETVSKVIQNFSSSCAKYIQEAFQKLDSLLKQGDSGEKQVDNLFPLCRPVINATENDKSNLLVTLIGDFMDIIQYNGDNTVYADITVKKTCDIMNDASRGDPIHRLVELNRLYLTEKKEHCVDFKYKKMVNELQQKGWKSSVAGGDRQWLYQDCNEFGYFQTTDSPDQIFGNLVPISFLLQQCKDIFGDKFSVKAVRKHVRAANAFYGGYNPTVTNALSVHGTCDPWHTLGITNNNTKGVEGILIEGTAHVADMYEPYYEDLPALTLARQQIVLFLNTILKISPQNEILKDFDSSSIIAVPTHKHNHHNKPGPGFLPTSSSLSNSTAVTGNVSADSSLLVSQPFTASLATSSLENSATHSSPVTIPSTSSATASPIHRGYMFPTIFPYHKKGIDSSSSSNAPAADTPNSADAAAANDANSPQNSATENAPRTSNQIYNANRPSARSPVVSSAPTNDLSNRPSAPSPVLPPMSDLPSASPTLNPPSMTASSPAASFQPQNSQTSADPAMSS